VSKSTIARVTPLEAPRDFTDVANEKHSEQLFAYRKAVA
jgi:hypothetical protein